MASREAKITILAFEVANTIAIGANLLQSLSNENIQFLKNEILHSEGVQQLVSTDMKELIAIAAADKREEFVVFSREVSRFGDLCKDPQWHNLGRYFSSLDWYPANYKWHVKDAKTAMQGLTTLAQYTFELYHQLNALSIVDLFYRRKLVEVESLHLPRRGGSLVILQSELRQQRKLVRSLKKKSLWSRSLDEVVENLVGIVIFMHQEILKAFGDNGLTLIRKDTNKPERLGAAGLALHYANIITLIGKIASRPTSLPSNVKDMLYHWLPATVKTLLPYKLQKIYGWEELTIPQIKAEMEKILQWLVPIATDTVKVHRAFRWVGEWANTGNEFGEKTITHNTLIRLQTLYHADKTKMDHYILELVTWLDRQIKHEYRPNYRIRELPSLSMNECKINGGKLSSEDRNSFAEVMKRGKLSSEDRNSLAEVMMRGRLVPEKVKAKNLGQSRSTGSSPRRGV